MNTRNIFHVISFLLLSAGILSAQIEKRAQVGFRFLENPVSAEAAGRGSAGITTTYTSNAVFWNPALLGWVEPSVDIGLHYTQGIADINYNAAAASVRLGEFGTLGFSLLSMDYGTFYKTYAVDNSVNDQGYIETGTFSPYAYAIGAAFSQKMNDRFSYGVHVKYAVQDLGEAWVAERDTIGERKYSAGILALDVGAFYDFLYNGIRFGAVLQNISREYKYESEAFPLPFAVTFGVSVTPLTFFSDGEQAKDLTLSFELRHPRDYGEKLKYSAEYSFIKMFTVRLGYMSNLDERGVTAGIGVKQEVGGFPLRVDYAYEPFGIFGNVHFISLGVSY